jgi:hypothetical protein
VNFRGEKPTQEEHIKSKSKSHYDLRSVGQFVSVSCPFLEQVARCYIYLSDNYFLCFSCRAPSLTKGRVCNLHCNDASSVPSYIATDGLSASSSWCRAPNGAQNQILIYLFDSYLSSRCRAPSPISPMSRVIQPKVKAKSRSHVSAVRNWNLGTNSAFALGPRKTTENLD